MTQPTKPKRVLTEADKMKLLWWRVWRADPKRPLRWTHSLKRAIVALATAPNSDTAAIFWIRLYGVLEEVRRGHEPPPPIPASPASAAVTLDPYEQMAQDQAVYFADLAIGVFTACVALLNSFTRDELLVIQWKRDDEAHAQLDGYELADRGGVLHAYRDKTLVGRAAHREVHDAVRAARTGRDDTTLAADFARRAAPHVDAIISALEEFPNH